MKERVANSWRILYLVGALVLQGCVTNTASVTGTIRYLDEAVPDGTIAFCVQGQVFETEIREGAYQISGLPLGEARITVVRLDPRQPDPLDAVKRARQRSAQNKKNAADAEILAHPERLEALERKRHLLPHKYSTLATTDLVIALAPGQNQFDIELKNPIRAAK